MAKVRIEKILPLAEELVESNEENAWLSYDREADVLYVSFRRPATADDSELDDDGTITRYKDGQVIGYTIPNFSMRRSS